MQNILVIGTSDVFKRMIKFALHDCSVDFTDYDECFKEYDKTFNMVILDFMECCDYQYIDYFKTKYACKVIIMINPHRSEDILNAMKSKADDYLINPLREKELMAKVMYHLDILKNIGDHEKDYVFDENNKMVLIEGKKIQLTKNEFKLCRLLEQNHKVAMSKETIYDILYALDADTQIRTITEYIYSIRKKFKCANIDPIKTIWGIGYKWIYETN